MLPSQLIPLLVAGNDDLNLAVPIIAPRFTDLAIVSSVNYFFSQNYSLAVNSVYCNETPEIDDTKNLVEVLVSTFEVPKFRRGNLKRVRTDVLVHIWYRAEESLYGAQDLADEVVDTFDHAVIDIYDYEATVGETKVGVLQLQEAETIDLSERQREDLSVNYHHLLVKICGVAQEIEF